MFFKYRIYWKLDVGANIQLAALDVSASFPVSVCMATHHIVNVGTSFLNLDLRLLYLVC